MKNAVYYFYRITLTALFILSPVYGHSMTIHYYGLSCFRLTSTLHDVSVLIDPPFQSAGWKIPRVNPDIVLFSSHSHQVPFKSKDGSASFAVTSPGEYEVKNIFVYGVDAKKKNTKGKGEEHTTFFVLAVDDVFVGHVGGLDRPLTEHELDQLGRIDILLLPVGGGSSLDAKGALEVVGQIEPRIVIPMEYKIPGLKGDLHPVDDFLKEYGTKDVKRDDKLKVMKKDLPAGDMSVIILNAA
jgi:L-ascorbate metabolism protein UlaG (beta-lactamase superfamily)